MEQIYVCNARPVAPCGGRPGRASAFSSLHKDTHPYTYMGGDKQRELTSSLSHYRSRTRLGEHGQCSAGRLRISGISASRRRRSLLARHKPDPAPSLIIAGRPRKSRGPDSSEASRRLPLSGWGGRPGARGQAFFSAHGRHKPLQS